MGPNNDVEEVDTEVFGFQSGQNLFVIEIVLF